MGKVLHEVYFVMIAASTKHSASDNPSLSGLYIIVAVSVLVPCPKNIYDQSTAGNTRHLIEEVAGSPLG